MSEEKKNLTDEERKELKDDLKGQVDELTDEELSQIAGGIYCPKIVVPILKNIRRCQYCNECIFGIDALYKHIQEKHPDKRSLS